MYLPPVVVIIGEYICIFFRVKSVVSYMYAAASAEMILKLCKNDAEVRNCACGILVN